MALGERGPKGDHGQHGDTGSTGEIGDTGDVGERGRSGAQGPVGERGPQGDIGHRGIQGKGAPRRALFGYLILVAAVGLAFYFTHRESVNRCRDAALNRAAIRETLTAGRDPLSLRPGDAGFSYYSSHPDEAQTAHDNRVAALKRFPVIHC